MSKIPISACIIAKNEEKYLEGCLKRLKPYGFEIIVTDTGSDDNTKEIAAKYADKVLDFEWIDDFSAARNFCAEHASNNWIFSIDCDEYINNADVSKIRILTQKFPRGLGVVVIENIALENGQRRYASDRVIRFYNRNHFHFCNRVHEQIMAKNPSMVKIDRFMLPMELIHHGYDIGAEEMKKKQQRNIKLLLKSLESNPDDPYLYFQMAQSNYVMQNYEEALEYYKKALSFEPDTNYEYVELLIMSMANAYIQLGRFKEELELLESYADKFKSAKFMFIHAVAFLDNGDFLKALLLFLKTVTLPDAWQLGENLADCYGNIIQIYRQMGEDKMADMFVEKYEALLAEKKRILNS